VAKEYAGKRFKTEYWQTYRRFNDLAHNDQEEVSGAESVGFAGQEFSQQSE
jgi:hypothetical protein